MNRQWQTWIGQAAFVTAAVMTAAVHAGPPALSSNPANLAIFPAKGQTPEQQRADESAAYDWATQQTRWDPYQAKAILDQQTHASAEAAGAATGVASCAHADPARIRTDAAARPIEKRILVPSPKMDNQPPVTSTTG